MTFAIVEPKKAEGELKKVYTPQEYLALEEGAEGKHEYRNEEIDPMAGGTTNHN